MLERIRRVILSSPFGPAAEWIHARLKRQSDDRNARYDLETVEVMQRVLGAEACAVDVGAHRGSILRQMIRIAPRGRHHAFEPLPDLAARLRARFPEVRIHQAAVGDAAGLATFVHVTNAPAYSGLRRRVYDRIQPVVKEITVEVVRLDDVLPADETVVFIKLDIEGGELHALRGAAHTIARCRPVIVFEAGVKSTGQYGVTPEEFSRFLAGEGYELSTMQRWLAGEPALGPSEFARHWHEGPDYYFIGYPAERSDRAGR